MRYARVVPALVLVLGALVGYLADQTHRPLSRPSAAADVGITRALLEDGPTAPAGFAEDDPWLPGMPGFEPPASEPATARRSLTMSEFLRDLGMDFRGLGGNGAGIGAPGLVNLDDVTMGLEDQASSPSAGAYFNDGSKSGDFRARTENVIARRFDDQWKSIMSDMERSLVPQVDTVVFPDNWLDEIARRGPMNRWPSRNFWDRVSSTRKRATFRPTFGEAQDEDLPLFGGETHEAVEAARSGDRNSSVADHIEVRRDEVANVRVDSQRAAATRFANLGRMHTANGNFDEAIEAFEDALFIINVCPYEVDWMGLDDVAKRGLAEARFGRTQDERLAKQRSVEEALAGLSAEEEDALLTEAERRARMLDPAFQARERARAEGEKATPPRTWRRAKATPNNARLLVGDTDELPIESMDIAVRVDGFRARVVLDAWFLNVHDRNLNGTYQVRLPTGASPHYFAFGKTALRKPTFEPPTGATLDAIRTQRTATWSNVKEARMVSREQAARAYTETVREGIDPALMEWAGAGVFAAQVFPLEPKSLHRIVLAYDIDLHREGENLIHTLDVPQDVPNVDIAITTERTFRYRNPTQARFITAVRDTGPVVLTGESAQAGALFATQVRPTLPDAPAQTSERAVFLLDTSASSDPDRFNTWLALLRALLEENRSTLREFAVGFFSVDTHWWREGFVRNEAANVERLIRDAHKLALEGATDIGQALASADAKEGAFDVFLLSDGGATWGETNAHAIASRLDATHACFGYVVAGGMADPALLALLARRSGGAVFPLLAEAEVRKVATAHASRPWVLEGVALEGTRDLLLAGAPTTLFPGQTLRLAGRGTPKAGAEVVLDVRQGEQTRTLRMPLGTVRPSPLTARTYGEVAVAQLEGLGGLAAKEARAYASHFRVVGQSCSLLMLESEEDYRRRQVKPEDETAVRTAPAAEVVEARVAEALSTLADPKARFLSRLDHWATLPVEYRPEITPELRASLETLPSSYFELPQHALRRTTRLRADVPAGITRVVGTGSLAYGIATIEAERRREAHGDDDALAFLSTLIEQTPGDLVLAGDLAQTAEAYGCLRVARDLLLRVADARPWQRPTWLAVARTFAFTDRWALAVPFFEAALGNGVMNYGALPQVAALEYERVLYGLAMDKHCTALREFARARLRTVAGMVGVEKADLMVILEWNTDRTDVDLHVTDPAGEECYYDHATTKMGGTLSKDVTTGFGPEIFILRKAAPGAYTIEAKYYAGDEVRTQARSRVFARIIEDYGTAKQRERRVTLMLKDKGDRNEIAVIKRP